MLDRYLLPQIAKPLIKLATPLTQRGVRANHITILGFLIGMSALPLLVFHHFIWALVAILINRTFDGLDGTLARQQGSRDSGGFLDIGLDFLFYSAIPFGFALAAPSENAIAAAFLIYAFVGTGSSFLAFASLASKHQLQSPHYPQKSFYYLSGITEGTETLICFILMCLFPQHFCLLAWIFGGLCWVTTTNRLIFGFKTLKALENTASDDPNQKDES